MPRAEYDALRAEGWTTTPKQSEAGQGEFAATWTPEREDTATSYAGIVGDEDAGPGERAADRAERFRGYLGTHMEEATGQADRYEGTDPAHGFQNAERAERAAGRHDRLAARAINLWEKAEHWEQRTRGVISHALYVSAPGVRMGRIKKLEADLRNSEKDAAEYAAEFARWKKTEAIPDADKRAKLVYFLANTSHARFNYPHPRPEECDNQHIWSLLHLEKGAISADEALRLWFSKNADPADREDSTAARWHRHFVNRLAYERQMLEAQGGRLEQTDIEPGGQIGGKLILKVSKSNATGRVTSCACLGPKVGEGWHYKVYNIPGTEWAEYTVKTERLKPEAYTPPTAETLAELAEIKARIKTAREETTPKAPPTINPTKAEAEKLQAIWNTEANKEMTQAEYSAASKGTYCKAEIVGIQPGGQIFHPYHTLTAQLDSVAKVRKYSRQVIILTDKPQKAFPSEVFNDPRPAIKRRVLSRLPELVKICGRGWRDEKWNAADRELFEEAQLVGLAYSNSMTQFGLTAEGFAAAKEGQEATA